MCDRRQHKKAIAFLAKPFDDYACSRLFTPRLGHEENNVVRLRASRLALVRCDESEHSN
jgi:hypothetical protein